MKTVFLSSTAKDLAGFRDGSARPSKALMAGTACGSRAVCTGYNDLPH